MKKIVPFTKDLMFKTKIGEITSIALDNTLALEDDFVSGEFIVSGTYKLLEESQIEEEFKYNIPVDISIDSKYDTKNCSVSIDDFSYEIINEESLKVNISVMLDDLDIKEDPIENIEVEDSNLERDFDFDLIDIDANINTEVSPKVDTDINAEVSSKIEAEVSPKVDTNISADVSPKVEAKVKAEINPEIDTHLDSNTISNSEDINIENEVGTKAFEEELFDNISEEHEYSIYRVYTVKDEDTLDIICDKFATNKEILADYNDLDNISVGSKIIIPSQDE